LHSSAIQNHSNLSLSWTIWRSCAVVAVTVFSRWTVARVICSFQLEFQSVPSQMHLGLLSLKLNFELSAWKDADCFSRVAESNLFPITCNLQAPPGNYIYIRVNLQGYIDNDTST
jgi:hypothetical protein